MNPLITFFLSEIIVVPLAMGIWKYRSMERSFRPFVILLMAAVLAEFSSFTFYIRLGIANADVFRVYSLVESILVLMLFHGWGFLIDRKRLFYLLLAVCFLAWLPESILYFGTPVFSPFFPILYSFIIVLVSINQINQIIITNTDRTLFKNSKFLLCIGFVIYFIYQILYEASYFVSDQTNSSYSLTTGIIGFFSYINFFVNLLYIPAVYFIPKEGGLFFTKNSKFELNNRNE